MTRTVLVAEDFSALGQISMIAALSVLQASNLETAALPTAILSTQTEGFGQPVAINTNQWVRQCLAHWQRAGVTLNDALVGYIGQSDIVRALIKLLQQFPLTAHIIIDPVMADDGRLYPGLASNYPVLMRQLCQSADVITPNWTELCFLTGHEPNLTPSPTHCRQLSHELRQQGVQADLVVTGIKRNGQEICLIDQAGDVHVLKTAHANGHFYGAGDTFAALLLTNLLQEMPLVSAVKASMGQLKIAIDDTQKLSPSQRTYGLRLGHLLSHLSQQSS